MPVPMSASPSGGHPGSTVSWLKAGTDSPRMTSRPANGTSEASGASVAGRPSNPSQVWSARRIAPEGAQRGRQRWVERLGLGRPLDDVVTGAVRDAKGTDSSARRASVFAAWSCQL